MSQENVEIVRAVIDALNREDWEAALKYSTYSLMDFMREYDNDYLPTTLWCGQSFKQSRSERRPVLDSPVPHPYHP
jgi:hypothetical protein